MAKMVYFCMVLLLCSCATNSQDRTNNPAKAEQSNKVAKESDKKPLPKAEKSDEKLLTVDAYEKPLGEIVEQISRAGGEKIICEKNARTIPVTIKLTNLPWRDLLEIVAGEYNCQISVKNNCRIIGVKSPVVTMESEKINKGWLGSYKGTDIREFIRKVASISKVEIVVPEDIKGTIYFLTKDLFWLDALKCAVEPQGYEVRRQNDGKWKITKAPSRKTTGGGGDIPPDSLAKNSKKISLDTYSTPLTEIIERITQETGQNIIAQDVDDVFVKVKLVDVPWRTALATIAGQYKCRIKNLPAGVIKIYKESTVTMQLDGADLTAIFIFIARVSGHNLILSEKEKSNVSMLMKNVPSSQAISAVGRACGYNVVVRPGKTWQVIPCREAKSPPSNKDTWKNADLPITIRLLNANPNDVISHMAKIVGKDAWVMGGNLQGNISLDLQNVTWKKAFDAIMKIVGSGVLDEPQGLIMKLMPTGRKAKTPARKNSYKNIYLHGIIHVPQKPEFSALFVDESRVLHEVKYYEKYKRRNISHPLGYGVEKITADRVIWKNAAGKTFPIDIEYDVGKTKLLAFPKED